MGLFKKVFRGIGRGIKKGAKGIGRGVKKVANSGVLKRVLPGAIGFASKLIPGGGIAHGVLKKGGRIIGSAFKGKLFGGKPKGKSISINRSGSTSGGIISQQMADEIREEMNSRHNNNQKKSNMNFLEKTWASIKKKPVQAAAIIAGLVASVWFAVSKLRGGKKRGR